MQTTARDTAYKIKNNNKFTTNDIHRAITVYEIVCKHNIELLEEADEIAENEKQSSQTISKNTTPSNDITLELVQKMVDWDRRKRILENWKWNVMKEVAEGRRTLTNQMKYAFYLNLEKLKKNGFEE